MHGQNQKVLNIKLHSAGTASACICLYSSINTLCSTGHSGSSQGLTGRKHQHNVQNYKINIPQSYFHQPGHFKLLFYTGKQRAGLKTESANVKKECRR